MATLNEPGRQPGRLATAPRWVAPVFAVLGAATLPWTVYLAMTLPTHQNTHHYRLTWVGFDIMLVVALLATAHLAARGNRFVGLLATVTATMLVLDAWFDINTSSHADRPGAILSAIFIELPLAAVCGWIALHVDQVIERRLRRLTQRAARLSGIAETESTALARARARQAAAKAHVAEKQAAKTHAAEADAAKTHAAEADAAKAQATGAHAANPHAAEAGAAKAHATGADRAEAHAAEHEDPRP